MIPVQAKFVGGVICAIFSLIGKVLFFSGNPFPPQLRKNGGYAKIQNFSQTPR